MEWQGAVRRVARRSVLLRAIGRSRVVWRAIRLGRTAAAIHPMVGFLVGEWRGGTRRYRTTSGSAVVVRHGTRDVDLINEILGHGHAYEPPPALAAALSGPLRILDLGGNIGMFGAFALSRWNVREIRSYEPDPENAAILAATISVNGAEERWTLTQAAVAQRSGTIRFLPGRLADSRQAAGDEAGIEVKTVDVFSLDHAIDLLKMDIEGGEWAILTDARLRELGAPIIVMEWHWRFAPHRDAHRAACDLLHAAGYEIELDRPGVPAGHTGVIWARRATQRAGATKTNRPCRSELHEPT
jgi:FkbM family methyltransferase